MEKEAILDELRDAGAFLEGHFILSSGLHSNVYIQCARLFIDAKRGEKLCHALAEEVREWSHEHELSPDVIVAPAMGGVIVGYEMGRQLGLPTMFCERVDGQFTLRRGFSLESGQRVLIVEDVITTGKSTMETARAIESYGATPIAVASIIDRVGNTPRDTSFNLPHIPLIAVPADTFTADSVPDRLKTIPAVKPGSRFLNKTA